MSEQHQRCYDWGHQVPQHRGQAPAPCQSSLTGCLPWKRMTALDAVLFLVSSSCFLVGSLLFGVYVSCGLLLRRLCQQHALVWLQL